MPKYKVTQDGFLAGIYRKTGKVIDLTEAQAKYYLPPYDRRLEPVKAEKPAEKPVTKE